MKRVLRIVSRLIFGLGIVLVVGYAILNITQSRQTISIASTALPPISSLQRMDGEEAIQQDTYFRTEFTKSTIPLFSINVVDVLSANYEKAVDNIEHQQAVMALMMNGMYKDTFHFTVQDYGNIKRILWINYFDYPYFNDLYALADSQGEGGADGWINLWKEFGELTEGYLWWASPQIDDELIPNASSTQEPLLANNIQSGIEQPFGIIPKNDATSSKKTLASMLGEMKATPGRFFSVSVLEVNERRYADTYKSIKSIQSKLRDVAGAAYNAPYHYSTQQYGDVIRILWINQFNDGQYQSIASVYSDGELWENYISGVDKYFWWASQEISEGRKAHANLLQKIKFIFKII
ncbi:hypothetical protein [Accumulibacter sp.]|nr:hypothetical protein [Accumulibacter sp.]HRF06137.1 hypothetical protein [Accumulibacter sp.]